MTTQNRPRFVWSKNSRVYHSTSYSTEECNLDDARRAGNIEEGDEPPNGAQLCVHCAGQQQFEHPVTGLEADTDA